MFFENNDDGCMPALSWRQRWYGFAFCFCFGSITSLFSSLALVKRDIPSFALRNRFDHLEIYFMSKFRLYFRVQMCWRTSLQMYKKYLDG
jgi:hypothetical protein